MRSLIKIIVLAAFAGITMVASAIEGWEVTMDAALAKAKSEKKPMLALFTGSEWCPPCIMMNKEVFGKKEFAQKAGKKFVLAFIDIRKEGNELSAESQKVVGTYKVRGFPTVILFTEEGKEFERFIPLKYPTVEKLLAYLDEALDKKDME